MHCVVFIQNFSLLCNWSVSFVFVFVFVFVFTVYVVYHIVMKGNILYEEYSGIIVTYSASHSTMSSLVISSPETLFFLL